MKTPEMTAPVDAKPEKAKLVGKGNGHANGQSRTDVSSADLAVILASLQTMRDGDFSVRLPGA
jgi:hypothetical protein